MNVLTKKALRMCVCVCVCVSWNVPSYRFFSLFHYFLVSGSCIQTDTYWHVQYQGTSKKTSQSPLQSMNLVHLMFKLRYPFWEHEQSHILKCFWTAWITHHHSENGHHANGISVSETKVEWCEIEWVRGHSSKPHLGNASVWACL